MTDGPAADRRCWLLLAALALVLCALALVRPIDGEEGRYVAAAALSAERLLPYRDYPWLRVPLQPLAFAPVAGMAGGWAWPALRVADALLGAAAAGFVFAAARAAGAGRGPALVAAGLLACCDALLSAAGTARDGALPAACLAAALWLAMRQEAQATRARALATGLLLAAAAAANAAYALPLLAYLGAAAGERRRLPAVVLAGVLPVAALVAAVAWRAPDGALPGVAGSFADPSSDARPWRAWALLVALGPALPALAIVAGRVATAGAAARLLALLTAAGLLAALVPAPGGPDPLPALPPLFAALALAWGPPSRAWRVALAAFAGVGLVPNLAALGAGAIGGPAMARAVRDGAAIRVAMDRAHVTGTVATLFPAYLPATFRLPDPRFVAGPAFLGPGRPPDPAVEARASLASPTRLDAVLAIRPEAFLIGGARGAGADAGLDAALADWATRHGYAATPVPGTGFRLLVRPR